MATVLHAPARLTAAQRRTTTTLYLAGPFEDGDGGEGAPRSWRDEVIDACADLDITIVDPRRADWDSLEVDSPGRRGAFDWQCASATDADVVVVWVPEGRRAPSALMILGHLAAKRGNATRGSSVVVGGGGWDGLVLLFAQNNQLFPMGDDLAEVIRVARIQLAAVLAVKAGA